MLILLLLIKAIRGDELNHISKRYYSYNPVQLPEIVINRANSNGNQGYVYPSPPPTLQFDDLIPIYGPQITTGAPIQEDVPLYIPPAADLNPPLSYPTNHNYLPPVINNYAANSKLSQIRIIGMSCINSGNTRFFKSSFQSTTFRDFPPVLDKAANINCIQGSGDTYQINIEGSQLSECGVTVCSEKDLCLQLRVPSVNGLKLPEDAVVILQCKPQSSVVSHTKLLAFKPQLIQGRTLGSIAAGGQERHFESQVALYKKVPGSNEFTQMVTSGSSVILGEDLLIKATVKEGDGWKFARMGSVIMQQGGLTARKSVTLVDSLGCRINAMKVVCPEHPKQVNPLVTTMPFRAFMFQGSGQSEMVLSVRMYACLQGEDCDQPRHCEEKVQGRIRVKRETENGTRPREDNITDWESYVDFKVVMPKSNTERTQNMQEHNFHTSAIFMAGAGVVVLLLFLVLFMRKYN